VNPYECRIALRPRGALASLDVAVVLLQAHAGAVARLAAVVLGPWAALAVVAWWFELGWALAALILALTPVLQAPFVAFGGRAAFGRPLGAREVLRDVTGQPAAMVALALAPLVWLVVSVGSLTLAAAPILVAGLFLPEVLLLERQRAFPAIGRTMALAGSATGAALVGALAVYGLPVWGALGADLLGLALFDTVLSMGRPLGTLDEGVVTPFLVWGWLAALPLSALTRLMVYLDARTAAEGWDLQVALMAARR
jgi:hypothetical protein